ncbi:hypothetical protein [Mycolicibacterium sp. 050158]|uniref:hypothetical protein n=1 Tax=Mycolicibacterium sp. 050158 TaxID=3090602 RepID=UPI00299EA36A|nr:hypothetical protein [Mycolicibacterium sp. 050158]MDX1888978.1 hypothetical protein [Mycolicibacterium sp. 050158]
MKVKDVKLFAVVGGSAAVTAAALGVAVLQGPASSVAGDMQTGATITQSAAPSTAPQEVATPQIKGPAPLPSEEQGLPG